MAGIWVSIEIQVFTFQEAADLTTRPSRNTEQAQYSMALPIAAALLDGEVGPRQVLPPRIQQQDLLQIMARVHVMAQEEHSRVFPARALAHVEIKTREEKRCRSETHAAPWDRDSRLPTDKEPGHKFQRLVSPVLGQETSRELEKRMWQFDAEPRVETLIANCCTL